MQKIILVGGSFDPPGLHHEKICLELRGSFPEARIVIVPCGPRKDKEARVAIEHRFAMAKIAFGNLPEFGIELDLSDMKRGSFSPTHLLDMKYSQEGSVWHFVGADIVRGGASADSQIHRVWSRGKEDFEKLRFLVATRPGIDLLVEDIPPNAYFVSINIKGSSTQIRENTRMGNAIEGLVKEEIRKYIIQNRLYQEEKR